VKAAVLHFAVSLCSSLVFYVFLGSNFNFYSDISLFPWTYSIIGVQ